MAGMWDEVAGASTACAQRRGVSSPWLVVYVVRVIPRTLVSGEWSGTYSQGAQRYPQSMTLTFADGIVRGGGSDDLGHFEVVGDYRSTGDEIRVGFIKTYDGSHSVLYLGVMEDSALVGEWRLQNGWGDAFSLSPDRAGRRAT